MPAGDGGRVVVWCAGRTVLAAAVEAVLEVAERDEEGRALTRLGLLDPVSVPGLTTDDADRAVIVRAADGPVALPADRIDGVVAYHGPVVDTPPWLEAVGPDYVRGLIRLDDDRIAAVLDTGALRAPS